MVGKFLDLQVSRDHVVESRTHFKTQLLHFFFMPSVLSPEASGNLGKGGRAPTRALRIWSDDLDIGSSL